MKNEERRMSDWLDHELDRLAIEGDRPTGGDAGSAYASESERALSDTIRRLSRLDAAEQAAPDPDFLRNLEQRLMPSNTISRPWSGSQLHASRQSALPSGAPLRGEPLMGRGTSRFSTFATLALVVTIVAMTLVVTTWNRNGGTTPEPTTGGFADVSSDATPAPGDPTPVNATDVTWSVPFADGTREASTGLMLVDNGLVYRQITMETGNEATGFTGIQAFHAANGELAWEHVMQWSRAGFAVDANGLYTVSVANNLIALSPESGEALWDVTTQSAVASMALSDGTLYVWDATNMMTAVDAANGEVLWTAASQSEGAFQLDGNGSPIISSEIVIGERTVAAITADGTLVAFDRATGEAIWSVPGFSALNSFTAVTDEMVLVLTTPEMGDRYEPFPDREGVGIDLESGDIRWTITVSGEVSIPVAPGGTGMFHIVADQIVVNESPEEMSTPQIDVDGGPSHLLPEATPNNIYGEQGPDGNVYVYGIDAQTGQVVWQRSSSGSGYAAIYVSNSSSESLWALTYDNAVIRLGGESGVVLDPPVVGIPDPIIRIVIGSLEEGAVAETRGGTIYGFGHVPFEEQG